MTPPRLPRRLLWLTLPAGHRALVVGDLDEEFRRHVSPSRSRPGAAAWYWRQALASLPAAVVLRMRARRLPAGVRRFDRPRPWAALWSDIGFGARLIRRRPGLTLAVVGTLAIGIAFTTAAVSLAHAVLLRGLPYPEADRLVHIGELEQSERFDLRARNAGGNVSWPDFLDYRSENRTFASIAGYSGGSRTLTGAGPAERVTMAEVTEGFFETLGVRPQLGRTFSVEDTRPGAPAVVIVTDGAWRRRFGADPGIIGRPIELNGRPTRIVGVLPADFQFPLRGLAEVWLPVRPSAAQAERRFFHWLNAIGRLRPGVTVEVAEADLNGVAGGFAAVDPQYHGSAAIALEPLDAFVVGDVRGTLVVLFAGACLVLAIGCTNVASLLLVRASGRTREMEVRRAIGASRWRLARQLLTESVVLAVPAAAIGLAAGHGLLRVFVASFPAAQRAALPHLESLTLEPPVMAWAAGSALVAALAFGLAPVWHLVGRAHRPAPWRAVGATRSEARLHAALVAAQVAVAIVLLTGAGLMGRTVSTLLAVSPGFRADGLLTMRVNLSGQPTFEAVMAARDELVERVAALPGVTGVSTIDQLPLTGTGNTGTFMIAGQPDGIERVTRVRTAAADYHAVMGVPIIAGRSFEATDRRGSPLVLLVNETFADRFFAGDPIGERIAFPFFDGEPFWEIVGVVGDEQFDGLDRPMGPVAYFAYHQAPGGALGIVVRTTGDPVALMPAVRAAIGAFDPRLPIFAARSMREIIETSGAVFRRRVVLQLVALFAAVALTLAAIGLYGLVAQTVASRRREIGVRMTLGAVPRQVVGGVFRRGLVPALAGLGVGLIVSLWATRLLTGLLFGVAPRDGLTLAAVTALLAATAVVACLVPARRALRLDPAETLRQD